MPIDLTILCRNLDPKKTAILFGAGSSIPSGGISGSALAQLLCERFAVKYDDTLSLAETATLVEMNRPRRDLISALQKTLSALRPTTGLLNLPLYDWHDLFTTNYDSLIERSYTLAHKPLRVVSSNFDFNDDAPFTEPTLYKLHGTLDTDRSLGHRSSIVLTTEDYDLATDFRELIFDRLLHETSRHDVLVVGHSLADPDLNLVLNETIRRKQKSGASGKLYCPNLFTGRKSSRTP